VRGIGTTVASLAAHGSNGSNLVGRTVCEVAGVGIVSHDGRVVKTVLFSSGYSCLKNFYFEKAERIVKCEESKSSLRLRGILYKSLL
jgi:hypothetical protein